MLKRIKVRNFLSLKAIELDLGIRNVLVGPNMSGKSNLIESLKFIQEAISPRESQEMSALFSAISKRGGLGEIAWKGRPEEPISFELAAELENGGERTLDRYKYEFVLRPGRFAPLEVEYEELSVQSNSRVKPLIENSSGKLKVSQGGQYTDGPQNKLGLALELYGRDPNSECHPFWNYVQGWRSYHLVPTLMRESNPPRWEKYLSEHGDNLSVWLFTLQNHTEDFNKIRQACRDVLPGVSEILFQPVEPPQTQISLRGGVPASLSLESSKISVGMSEKDFRKPIAISRMSDGELAFLALISVILAPDELVPSLLCIEEPENHLHPTLVEVLIELINQRQMEAHAPQIIATTHSPLLVDKLAIEELVITERSDGSTRFIRASNKKHLKKLLSDKVLGLGDLWYSGALSSS